MSLFLELLAAFVLSCVLSIFWTVISFLLGSKYHRPRHQWSGFNLYGFIYIFPVAVILLFGAINIILFTSNLFSLFAILPVLTLFFATISLFQSIQKY